jgi:hypothetical protein
MSVIEKLASSQNESGTEPNKALARQIADTNDTAAIKELVGNLHNKSIQSDCIKVLYEAGEIRPELIAGYAKDFIGLLDNKNNRMQWGAMIALHTITEQNAGLVYNALDKITTIADKGSVITKDHCAGILIKLAGMEQYALNAFSLFIDLLQSCPSNQVPMYAEQAVPVINSDNKTKFLKVLNDRLHDVEKDAKKARVKKVIQKLTGQ